eukprot:g12307.t1
MAPTREKSISRSWRIPTPQLLACTAHYMTVSGSHDVQHHGPSRSHLRWTSPPTARRVEPCQVGSLSRSPAHFSSLHLGSAVTSKCTPGKLCGTHMS